MRSFVVFKRIYCKYTSKNKYKVKCKGETEEFRNENIQLSQISSFLFLDKILNKWYNHIVKKWSNIKCIQWKILPL